jgi:MarR family transcriptional regulator, lower aerobic nicotinate degradation pathway regulator
MTSRPEPGRGAPRELSPVDGMAQLSFLVQRMLERLVAQHELSLIQARLLGVLRDRRPTINELARLLALDKSSVSGLVERAERRGLVARARSPADGRSVLVSLTGAGRALAGEVSARFDADVTALLSHLSKHDRRVLNALVSRLLVAEAAAQGIDLFGPDEARGGVHQQAVAATSASPPSSSGCPDPAC